MSEFTPICPATGAECPARAKLIDGLDGRTAIASALATELFTQFDRRIKLIDSTSKGEEILKDATTNCEGTDCLVTDGLIEEFLRY